MRTHMLDLGFSSQDVEEHLIVTGYWNTESKRERHACVLTPCAYILHEESQLTDAARALHAAVMQLETTLAGLSQRHHLAHAESRFLRMAKSASHGLLRPERLGFGDSPHGQNRHGERSKRRVVRSRSRHVQSPCPGYDRA